ncbi:MAG: HAMP domain-containing protein [Nitrospiraceae bacterium]|nr:MAG: HAMP domain-containing protein [Nitrospiraceae bacterium]
MLSADILKLKRKSFGTRILLIVTLFIMVMYVTFAMVFVLYQSETLNDHLLHEGEQLARLTAYNARIGVFSENDDLLKDTLEAILMYKEALVVQVYTSDGRLLQTRVKAGMPKPTDLTSENPDVHASVMSNVKSSGTHNIIENSNDVDIWAPVVSGGTYTEESLLLNETQPATEEIIGFIRIVLSKAELHKLMKDTIKNSLVVLGFFMLAGWIVSYFVIRRITGPLVRLTAGVKSLEATGMFEKVPVETGDEIGSLAFAFNNMAETLKKRDEEKQQLEEHLRHSQKMEAIGTFAGGIAHDFNNMLTVIKSYGQMLQKKDLKGEDERRFVDHIMSSAHKASALTRGLLALSRKQTTAFCPVDLNLLVSGLEGILKGIIDESIQLEIITSKEGLTVVADKLQLEHVVINLVTNAKDSMPDGGKIVIATKLSEVQKNPPGDGGAHARGRYAQLSVSDTGAGIDEQTKERMLDPFFTTKDVGKGTGLGLYIVYGIVTRHKGYLDVRSEKGRGTAFDIFLPLSNKVPEAGVAEVVQAVKGGTETILLAEDDDQVRTLLTDILTGVGYTVIAARDGDEAVNKFITHKDLIQFLLLDVMMPKKNGKAVLEEIRRTVPDTRYLFISGYAAEVLEGHKKGLFNGPMLPEDGKYLLYKPLVPEDVLRRVREMLDK